MAPDARAIRLSRRGAIHATRDYQRTLCDRHCIGIHIAADGVPTCKRCLRALLGDTE